MNKSTIKKAVGTAVLSAMAFAPFAVAQAADPAPAVNVAEDGPTAENMDGVFYLGVVGNNTWDVNVPVIFVAEFKDKEAEAREAIDRIATPENELAAEILEDYGKDADYLGVGKPLVNTKMSIPESLLDMWEEEARKLDYMDMTAYDKAMKDGDIDDILDAYEAAVNSGLEKVGVEPIELGRGNEHADSMATQAIAVTLKDGDIELIEAMEHRGEEGGSGYYIHSSEADGSQHLVIN